MSRTRSDESTDEGTEAGTGAAVRRTRVLMADGRELFYFDDTEPYLSGEPRPGEDSRDLPPATGGSRMRLDPLTGEWVPMASNRMNRTHLPPREMCPLCPTAPGGLGTEIPAAGYDVVVFENRFPSLSTRDEEPDSLVDGDPMWPERAAAGRAEVVCFTAEHDASFASLRPARARTVIEAWADRTAELAALPHVRDVFCFENRGAEIGVTLAHPHGQVYAYPYVPPRTAQHTARAAAHHARTGRDLVGDALAAEVGSGRRVVARGEHWTAFVPAAARWPVEVHVVPHRHVLDLAELDDAERDELAHLYPDLLARLDGFFVGPAGEAITLPYIAGWFAAPVGPERDGERDALPRLHLQVFSVLRAAGKLKYLAGSESGQGAWVSDTTPERVADRLRELPSAFPGAVVTGDPSAAAAAQPEAAPSLDPSTPVAGAVPSAPDLVPAADPAEHLATVTASFVRLTGHEPDGVWAAPGRVNLVGEHLDYNGGPVLPFAIEHRGLVAAGRRDDGRWRLASRQDDATWEGGPEDLVPGTVEGWAGYAAGVLWALREAGHDVPGLDIAVDGRVPVGAGLSSSASLTSGVAVAVADLAGLPGADPDDEPGRRALAEACVRAENEFAGAPTGGMDQAVVLRARQGHALLLDCTTFDAEHLLLPLGGKEAAELLVVDTRAHHSLVDGRYGGRRAACETAADRLGVGRLADITLDELPDALSRLDDEELERVVRHVVTETDRVRQVAALLREGRLDATGPHLLASHDSMRDDFRISVAELDLVVTSAVDAGALGARMTGGGFGGSAVVLCRAGTAGDVGRAVHEAFLAAGYGAPGLLPATASGGAGRVV